MAKYVYSYDELEHLNRALAAIRNVNQLIIQEKDAELLIKKACSLLTETGGYTGAWIPIFSYNRQVDHCVEAGYGSEFTKIIEMIRANSPPYCIESAMREPGIHTHEIRENDCGDCPMYGERLARCIVSTQLAYGERVFGLLVVEIPSLFVQIEKEQELIAEVAHDLAFALNTIEQEERLRVSEKRFHFLFENFLSGVLYFDTEGRIQEINQVMVDMLGLPSKEATKDINVLQFPPLVESGYSASFRRCIEEGTPIYDESSYTSQWGQQIYAKYYLRPVFYEGEIIGVLGNIEDVTSLRKTQQALAQSSNNFLQIAETIDEVFWLKQGEQLLYINSAYERVWEQSRDSLYQNPAEFLSNIHPDDYERIHKAYEQCRQTDLFNESYRIRRPDGSIRWIWARTFPVGEHNSYRRVGVAEDITDRVEIEEQLKGALKEKEVLLRELYHRTKNNMQVISSMLGLRAMQTQNDEVKQLALDTDSRIKAMALVHQKLYSEQNLSSVNMYDYINELTYLMLSSYDIDHSSVELSLQISEEPLLLDVAIPIGLIVVELFSNSLKYAFPRGWGQVSISLQRIAGDQLSLVYADDGVGLSADYDIRQSDALGLQTVFTIAEHQLQGSISYSTQPGLRFDIVFSNKYYRERV